MTQQDIVSMDNLIEACKDDEFVSKEMWNDGLKIFKKNLFIEVVIVLINNLCIVLQIQK